MEVPFELQKSACSYLNFLVCTLQFIQRTHHVGACLLCSCNACSNFPVLPEICIINITLFQFTLLFFTVYAKSECPWQHWTDSEYSDYGLLANLRAYGGPPAPRGNEHHGLYKYWSVRSTDTWFSICIEKEMQSYLFKIKFVSLQFPLSF